jgi:hypothetical protein
MELISPSIQVIRRQTRNVLSTNARDAKNTELDVFRILFVENTIKERVFPSKPTTTITGMQMFLITLMASIQGDTDTWS